MPEPFRLIPATCTVCRGHAVLARRSIWIVPDTSHLGRLVLDECSAIMAAAGSVSMTVNGVETPIETGTDEGRNVNKRKEGI